jgi:hypothetical protein
MAEYIVDSSNQETETLLVAYRDARGGVQATAGQMYTAIARTEAAYVELETALGEGGPLAALGEYHATKQAPVGDAVARLRQSMAGVMALMEQMQAGYAQLVPGGILFPGVPVTPAEGGQ